MLVSDMFFLNHIRYEFVLVTENWLEPLNKTVNGQFSYLCNDVCICILRNFKDKCSNSTCSDS